MSLKCRNDTDVFDCPLGLRQWCNLSLILFSLFINELATDISSCGGHGVQLTPSLVEIFISMFADDVALVADTVVGLQRQLNTLNTFCKKIKLKVNTSKTKVLVFVSPEKCSALEP